MQELRQLDKHARMWIALIKGFHSLILLLMSAAVLYILYSGITGTRETLLWLALGLISFESLVYLGYRARCPLTVLAKRLGDATGNDYLSDWLLPPVWVRLTAPVCGSLFVLGLLLILLSLGLELIS